MGLEEFGDLPPRLEDWTIDTVENIVKKYAFEPGAFDYKDVLNPTGPNQNTYVASIRQTACSMANTGGGFILFGVKDRKIAVAVPKDRITGISIGGDLLREFGNKIESVQPEIYFEAVPQVLPLRTDPSRGVFVVKIPHSQRRPHMALPEGVYYRRGDGGSAVPMTHYEVREQMMYTEDRKQKVNLLRMELAQYMEIALDVRSEIDSTFYRFDVSAFKVLLAEVCGLIPSNLLRDLLNVPKNAEVMNKRLEHIYGRNDETEMAHIARDLIEFYKFCANCEASLESIFGPLGRENA